MFLRQENKVFVISIRFTWNLTGQYNVLNISELPTEKNLFVTCTLNQ